MKADLGRVLLALEGVHEDTRRAAARPAPVMATLSAAEEAAALALLRDPQLIERILADFAAAGTVGERTNALVGYLAAVSRLLTRPLAVLIQSSSAACKSNLMDAILAFIPDEAQVRYSAVTGQSLFYLGQTQLTHKILAIAEQEGAQRAAYALKLLHSEGVLTIASTGSDPQTGQLVTQEYRVEGPTALFLTTTAIDLDEELLNRCLVLAVDEDRAQTRAIHQRQRQRRTLAGLCQQQTQQAVLTVHRHAQRLLQPLAVVNPWADRLTFLDDRTRTRRDHEKYLTLIDAIALLHQQQRPRQTVTVAGQAVAYLEVTLEDIALANRLAHEVLGRSLDELPPQTRRVLARLRAWVQAQTQAQGLTPRALRFTRADLRPVLGISDTQLKIHLARLVELEYLLLHRVPHGQGYRYELLYDGDDADDRPHLSGLIDPGTLVASGYDPARSAQPQARSADLPAQSVSHTAPTDWGRGVVVAKSGGCPTDLRDENPLTDHVFPTSPLKTANTLLRPLPPSVVVPPVVSPVTGHSGVMTPALASGSAVVASAYASGSSRLPTA